MVDAAVVQACWWEGLVPPRWWVELGCVPLVGRALSRAVLSGQLWAHEDFKQPVCYASALVGCLAWGVPALELIGCWDESDLGEKTVASRSAHATKNTPELLQPVSLSPQWAAAVPAAPPTLQENLLYQQVGLTQAQALMKPLLSPLVPDVYETLCVTFKSGVSLSSVLRSNPTDLQSQILWGLLFPLPDTQPGKPDVGLRTFTLFEKPLQCNSFPVCGSPTWGLWDLILSWLCPSYCLTAVSSLSLDLGCLFWQVPVRFLLLLLLVVRWLVEMLMFPYEVWSCPSILPSSGATLVMCEESGFLRWNLLLVKMLWRLLKWQHRIYSTISCY